MYQLHLPLMVIIVGVAKISTSFDIEQPLKVMELGQVIRPSVPTVIVEQQQERLGESNKYRLKRSYVTVDLQKSNLTVIRYTDILPFSAKGCIPVFFSGDNPQNITYDTISWMNIREQWTIVIFNNEVTHMDEKVVELFRRSIVIVGSFRHAPLHQEVQEQLMRKEIMTISNLKSHPLLPKNESTTFVGYLLLFEVLSRYSVELPILANLIVVEHKPQSLRCSRTRGRRLEVLNHDFTGRIPIHPGYSIPKIVGDDLIEFPDQYGTHIEPPYHMMESGFNAAEVPPERTFVPCIRVHQYNATVNHLITAATFKEWERSTGVTIPRGSFVFVDTRQNRKWTNPEEYLGYNRLEDKDEGYMGVDADAVQWLIDVRSLCFFFF